MTKKLISALIALALTFILPTALADTKTAWVKMDSASGSLNLRGGPSKSFESVGYVKAGDSIKVYTGTEQIDFEGEEWIQIKVDRTGKTGYIKTKYVSYSASQAVTAENTLYISKTGGTMNVRSGPGTGFSVVCIAQHGETIKVLERGATWSKITVTRLNKTGYIKTKYIKGSASTGVNTSTSASTTGGTSKSLRNGSYDVAQITTKTAGGTVNLRSGAGTGYASLGTLARGSRLDVLGSSGAWYRVRTQAGTTGYVRSDFVSFGVKGTINGSVNLRSGAGTNYGVLRTLSAGATVTVHSVSGNWARVTAGSTSGYVYITYISI